jgi:uncharacterized alkaline shock family protein YloU
MRKPSTAGGTNMAENKEYYTQTAENGAIQISEDVVGTIAATAAMEVDGVCGLSPNFSADIAEMLSKKSWGKGIRLTTGEDESLTVDCNVVAKFGQSVLELAKNVQDAVKSSLESITGLRVDKVNVNICGIALPKETKK